MQTLCKSYAAERFILSPFTMQKVNVKTNDGVMTELSVGLSDAAENLRSDERQKMMC